MLPSQIVLIGNYSKDGQQSMQRYAALLQRELRGRKFVVDLICPQCFFGYLASSSLSGLGKWLGYLDKYLVFPFYLVLKQLQLGWRPASTVVHITDHSNALYRRFIWRFACVATCHDVLAVRGAFGDDEAFCPASPAGKLLQKMILNGLASTSFIGCVSDATRMDLEKLTARCGDPGIRTICSGLNSPFHPLPSKQVSEWMNDAGINLSKPYLLHVGSSLPRKNRDCVIRTLARLLPEWDGCAVFAGAGLSGALNQLALDLGVKDRVIEIKGPSDEILNALYAGAHALVFPSYAEGFGWPLLEAQASGCPVICSDRTSVPEVAGDGALVAPADDVEKIASFVRTLEDKTIRTELIQRGFKNLERFDNRRMMDGYMALYQDALAEAGHAS